MSHALNAHTQPKKLVGPFYFNTFFLLLLFGCLVLRGADEPLAFNRTSLYTAPHSHSGRVGVCGRFLFILHFFFLIRNAFYLIRLRVCVSHCLITTRSTHMRLVRWL